MPYSFTRIEKEKTWVVNFIFLTTAVFYFIAFWVLIVVLRMFFYQWIVIKAPGVEYHIRLLNTSETIFVLAFAVFVACFHWMVATRRLTSRIVEALRAKRPDPANLSHRQFENILEELSAATGGEKFQGYIIPSFSINAFAACDLEGRNVIGVTEGMLSRLKRPQIEAVLAHAAAHILTGDSVDTTVMVSLFNLPLETFKSIELGDDSDLLLAATRISIQGMLTFAALSILVLLVKTFGQLFHIFISHQREYRADAIAVRLTRDPLSLAERLYLASYHWHGAGSRGENLSPLFLVRPRYDEFKEEGRVFAGLFSTHPPLERRLHILLEMAHTNLDLLEKSLFGNYRKFLKDMETAEEKEPHWFLRENRQWSGPFSIDEIETMTWVQPQTLVKRLGEITIAAAGTDERLKKIFEKARNPLETRLYCPHCYLFLEPVIYEDFVILQCRGCRGVLVQGMDIRAILNRREAVFDEKIARMAEIAHKEKITTQDAGEREMYTHYRLTCPQCLNYEQKMTRKFYDTHLPVEIDECPLCRQTWFDKLELEILQFSHNHIHPDL